MTPEPSHIEALRLTDLDMAKVFSDTEHKPYFRAIADAQLDRVLDASVTCPRCDGKKNVSMESKGFLYKHGGYSGAIINYDAPNTIDVPCTNCHGTGTVTIRTLLERDGGEK